METLSLPGSGVGVFRARASRGEPEFPAGRRGERGERGVRPGRQPTRNRWLLLWRLSSRYCLALGFPRRGSWPLSEPSQASVGPSSRGEVRCAFVAGELASWPHGTPGLTQCQPRSEVDWVIPGAVHGADSPSLLPFVEGRGASRPASTVY